MTQELIFWVLLFGSVGLLWVFTCAILTQDRSTNRSRDERVTEDKQESDTAKGSRRKVAA
jgi:hypothetical protein